MEQRNLNRKALALTAIILIAAISSGYAYTNYYAIEDAEVYVSDSNVTVTNSTVTLGENATITNPPEPTPTPEPKPTLSPTPTPQPTPEPIKQLTVTWQETKRFYTIELVSDDPKYMSYYIGAGTGNLWVDVKVNIGNFKSSGTSFSLYGEYFYVTLADGTRIFNYEGYGIYKVGRTFEFAEINYKLDYDTITLRFNMPENATEYLLGYNGDLSGFQVNWVKQ